MSEFVHFISNPGTDYKPDDNILEFNTPLYDPMVFEDGEWEVALVQLHYPKLYKPINLTFLAYLDCIAPRNVGSRKFQCLSLFTFENSNKSEQFVKNVFTPINPKYFKINKDRLEILDFFIIPTQRRISIKGLPFVRGDIEGDLHFRKI